MSLPDLTTPFEIEVDASKFGFGAVLLQEVDGKLRPCAYYSKTTTATERRWAHPNRLEARAIVWAVDRLSEFLRAQPFTIRTDARNLLWLMNGKYQSGIRARWVMKLSEYDFIIKHATVPAADALSRAPAFASVAGAPVDGLVSAFVAPIDSSLSSIVPINVSLASDKVDFTLESVVEAQESDPWCRSVIDSIHSQTAMISFFLDGKCLRYRFTDAFGTFTPVVLPAQFRARAIRSVHESALTGHLGVHETLGILRRQFYWPT
ncbi:MAG: RNase H-like domain-containing protein, partial [Cyanobacteria bacterium P01_A01_bin.17]